MSLCLIGTQISTLLLAWLDYSVQTKARSTKRVAMLILKANLCIYGGGPVVASIWHWAAEYALHPSCREDN